MALKGMCHAKLDSEIVVSSLYRSTADILWALLVVVSSVARKENGVPLKTWRHIVQFDRIAAEWSRGGGWLLPSPPATMKPPEYTVEEADKWVVRQERKKPE